MAYAHSCPVVSGRSVYKLGIGSFLFIVLSGRTTGDQAGNGRCLNTTHLFSIGTGLVLYKWLFFLYPECIN